MSKKCKKKYAFEEIWRIISEQVRISLSTYVRNTNSRNNRIGKKVGRSYIRYYFESIDEVIEEMKKMDEQEIGQCQPNERYQGAACLFEMSEKEVSNSIYFGCE